MDGNCFLVAWNYGSAFLNMTQQAKKSGRKNPNWRGGIIKSQGRVLIYKPEHPYPNLCKVYVFRYRLEMEKHIGRYLLPSEIVHHINGVTDDDRIDNLEVVSPKEHSRIHKSYLRATEARMEKYRARIALNPPKPKRIARRLEHDGRSMTVAEWASELGIDKSVIHMRIHSGWSIARILSTPKRPQTRRTC